MLFCEAAGCNVTQKWCAESLHFYGVVCWKTVMICLLLDINVDGLVLFISSSI